ncbi:putative voltage-dependent T-type calcium channel subunit alpha-1I-like [Triplophysa rosa]|uniref:Voltage-dependent T-type calcium channel subunit alpha-1I-like n=1 Tax=Triplophysa rosa TaxID=992332 RepID=A0A9W7TRE2_TRIRA|nr:putative voltage-dependent T-type calcium channel subunit alpha-1I-like [Triplophysa rosa]
MAANGGFLDVEELWHLSSYSGRGKGENGKLDSAHHHSNTLTVGRFRVLGQKKSGLLDLIEVSGDNGTSWSTAGRRESGCCSVAMTTEECPVPLGVSQVGARRFEDFGSSQGDDIIEEVGPCDDAGSDLSTLVVPFPELAPVVFFCLKQTTCPRNWCIRMAATTALGPQTPLESVLNRISRLCVGLADTLIWLGSAKAFYTR